MSRPQQRRPDPSFPPPFILYACLRDAKVGNTQAVLFLDDLDEPAVPFLYGLPQVTVDGEPCVSAAVVVDRVVFTFANPVPSGAVFKLKSWDEAMRFPNGGWCASAQWETA